MTIDPDGGDRRNPQTINPYAYSGNNPIGNTDPDGTHYSSIVGWYHTHTWYGWISGPYYAGGYWVQTVHQGWRWKEFRVRYYGINRWIGYVASFVIGILTAMISKAIWLRFISGGAVTWVSGILLTEKDYRWWDPGFFYYILKGNYYVLL